MHAHIWPRTTVTIMFMICSKKYIVNILNCGMDIEILELKTKVNLNHLNQLNHHIVELCLDAKTIQETWL